MWYSAFVKENVFVGIVSVNEAITIHDVVPVPKIHFLEAPLIYLIRLWHHSMTCLVGLERCGTYSEITVPSILDDLVVGGRC